MSMSKNDSPAIDPNNSEENSLKFKENGILFFSVVVREEKV